jgi:hypothetical protein
MEAAADFGGGGKETPEQKAGAVRERAGGEEAGGVGAHGEAGGSGENLMASPKEKVVVDGGGCECVENFRGDRGIDPVSGEGEHKVNGAAGVPAGGGLLDELPIYGSRRVAEKLGDVADGFDGEAIAPFVAGVTCGVKAEMQEEVFWGEHEGRLAADGDGATAGPKFFGGEREGGVRGLNVGVEFDGELVFGREGIEVVVFAELVREGLVGGEGVSAFQEDLRGVEELVAREEEVEIRHGAKGDVAVDFLRGGGAFEDDGADAVGAEGGKDFFKLKVKAKVGGAGAEVGGAEGRANIGGEGGQGVEMVMEEGEEVEAAGEFEEGVPVGGIPRRDEAGEVARGVETGEKGEVC